ncbi:CHAT domain-containing protein [Candidatus Pelagibacter ubique]|nr:CHAT domain-containing protein [Candidatus Pelagibacter ubique]
MKKNTTKLLILFFTIFILQNNIVHSKIFKFNNLEEARKIYSSNPTKAHDLLDKTIKYYIKKPNKDWPWLGWAYSDKANFLSDEGKKKIALEYQSKACKIQEQDFKKIKINHKKQNLVQCYYFLSTLLEKNELLKESLKISTEALNIFEEFKDKNYKIYDYAGLKEYSNQLVQRARVYKDLFRYEESIRDYENYIKIVAIKNVKELASNNYLRALSEIEFVYSTRGDTDNEYKYLKLRFDIIQQYSKNNLNQQAKINRDMGFHHQSLNQYDKAILYYDSALMFIKKSLEVNNNYTNKKKIFSHKEMALLGKLKSEQSIKKDLNRYKEVSSILFLMNEELNLLDKSTGPYDVLDSYYSLITDYPNRKINLTNAKKLVDLQIIEAKKNNSWTLKFYLRDKRNLMNAEAWNDLDLENFDNALKIAIELKSYETEDAGISEVTKKVDLRNLFGQIYSGQKNYKKAIDNYLSALNILNESFEKDFDKESTILNNLALAYNNIGEIELANKYIKLATQRTENLNQDDFSLIMNYNNRAALAMIEEDVLKYSKKSYELFNSSKTISKNSTPFVNTINFLGGYYLTKGHHEKNDIKKREYYTVAKKYYDEAIEHVEKEMVKNIFPYHEYLYNYSDLLALLDNNNDQCIKYLTAASKSIEIINPKDERLIANYTLLYACYYKEKRMDEAFDVSLKSMFVILNKFDQQNFDLNFNSDYQSISMYKDQVHSFIFEVLKSSHKNIEIFDKYKDINFINLMFGLQQVVKSNKLTAKLSESITRQISKDERVSAELRKYTSLLKKKREILKLDSIDPDKIKKRNQEISKLNKELENLLKDILKKYPDLKKNFANQVVTGGLLNQDMPEDEVIIQYTVGTFFTFATIITSDDYTVQRIGANKDKLSKLIKEVRNSLELKNGKPVAFALSQSQELHDILLGNFADIIKNKKKIIIIPDGPLYGIPFELLHDKRSNQWLIEKNAISTSPSAYSYIALNFENNLKFNTGNSFLGFGDPNIKGTKIAESSDFEDILELEFSKVFTRGGDIDLKYLRMFPELPETATELKKISKKFDQNSKLYLRDDFNEDKINSINFNKYKVVSFASHALVVGEIDGLSEPSIVLSLPKKITDDDDGLLTASEIINLNINSDLVILSACNTAASDGNANSEALSGLANSFFYSGAKSLMVTHWSVISNTSVDLMTDTFDFLESSNEDLSIALMKSKIKMLNNPDTSHPIFWAPYTLVGRTKMSIGN